MNGFFRGALDEKVLQEIRIRCDFHPCSDRIFSLLLEKALILQES
jgi:hypothetical protein